MCGPLVAHSNLALISGIHYTSQSLSINWRNLDILIRTLYRKSFPPIQLMVAKGRPHKEMPGPPIRSTRLVTKAVHLMGLPLKWQIEIKFDPSDGLDHSTVRPTERSFQTGEVVHKLPSVGPTYWSVSITTFDILITSSTIIAATRKGVVG